MREVEKEMNDLIGKYQFPFEILADVNKRLMDNPNDKYYAQQQLRFLKNAVRMGYAKKRN